MLRFKSTSSQSFSLTQHIQECAVCVRVCLCIRVCAPRNQNNVRVCVCACVCVCTFVNAHRNTGRSRRALFTIWPDCLRRHRKQTILPLIACSIKSKDHARSTTSTSKLMRYYGPHLLSLTVSALDIGQLERKMILRALGAWKLCVSGRSRETETACEPDKDSVRESESERKRAVILLIARQS